MASSSEDVHLMVNKVKYKKREGTIYLMSERVAWCPHGKDHFEVSHLYADVKCQKISPEGKAKIQLQIVLLDGESKTFHFANSDPEEAKGQRNRVKDILAEMIPKFRRKVDKDLEEKNKLLQNDSELFQIYKDLVGAQVITPEEFWETHAKKLSSGASGGLKQKVGVSASFLADVKPQSDGCNGLRYNLTIDKIESIFRTYPAVRKKYMDKVPDKMSEKEFWTLFFQSHYFHRDRVNQNSKDIFYDCAKKDDQDILSLLKGGVKDSLIDLSNMDDEDSSRGEGYGSTTSSVAPPGNVKQSSTQVMNKTIIKRFNHESAMVLSACSTDPSLQNGNGDASENLSGAKKMRLHEVTQYDDLSENQTKQSTSLNLQKSERYSHGPTLLSEVRGEMNGTSIMEGLHIVTNQCFSYKPRLSQVLTSSTASTALKELSDLGVESSISSSFIDHVLPAHLRTELQHLYASSTELLRHFWLCFPVNTSFLQEKVVRMHRSIENFRVTKLESFKQALLHNRVELNLAQHIEDMFDTAAAKFNSWQSKKLGKR